MNTCTNCNNQGLPDGCPKCGKYHFGTTVTEEEVKHVDFTMPAYYRKNQWTPTKIKASDNDGTTSVLVVVDKMITQVASGKELNASYAILLPYGYGKKTAMFSIIQHYLKNKFTVAPVIDIATLAIMENNFRSNEKDSMETWKKLTTADLTCVYGVDFSARYQTMKLFLNVCSMRGLRGKPTLLFAENSLQDLRSNYIADNLTPDNNTRDIGCRLSHPYILDGVIRRK
jgi:hypothetical protein